MKIRLEQELVRVENWIRSHSYFNHNAKRCPWNATEDELEKFLNRRDDIDCKILRIRNINPVLPNRLELVRLAIKRIEHKELVVSEVEKYKADRKEKRALGVVFKERNESLYKRRAQIEGAIIATLYQIPDDGIRYDVKRRIEVCISDGKILESDVRRSFNARSGANKYLEKILNVMKSHNLITELLIFNREQYLSKILDAYKTKRPVIILESIIKELRDLGLDDDSIKLIKSEAMMIRKSNRLDQTDTH